MSSLKTLSKCLCLTGVKKEFGLGHLTRMIHLKNALLNVGSDIEIFTEVSYFKKKLRELTQNQKQNQEPIKILLDRRDAAFPNELLEQKENYILIAVDNRGEGRVQADFIWDALPHSDMNMTEFKKSLRKVMLPLYLTKKKSQVRRSVIEITDFKDEYIKEDTESDPLFVNLVQGGACADERRCLPLAKRVGENKYNSFIEQQEKYMIQMNQQEAVYTYFGQTLFEAIYLGKKIYLYDISPYHLALTRSFIEKWSNIKPEYYLDGKGISRLVQLITAL